MRPSACIGMEGGRPRFRTAWAGGAASVKSQGASFFRDGSRCRLIAVPVTSINGEMKIRHRPGAWRGGGHRGAGLRTCLEPFCLCSHFHLLRRAEMTSWSKAGTEMMLKANINGCNQKQMDVTKKRMRPGGGRVRLALFFPISFLPRLSPASRTCGPSAAARRRIR